MHAIMCFAMLKVPSKMDGNISCAMVRDGLTSFSDHGLIISGSVAQWNYVELWFKAFAVLSGKCNAIALWRSTLANRIGEAV
jgi:hypothetical protein